MLHANLAIELAATGEDRDQAVWNARQALTALPRLMTASAAALPETLSVLLFADQAAEARDAAGQWLRLTQQQGSEPAVATAMGFASLHRLYGGQVSEAVAFGQQGIAGTPNIWISTITSSFVVRALVERGEPESARSLLAGLGLAGDLIPTWPHNLVRHARGCLHAAAGDHAAAAEDLLQAGELAQQWGIPNPAILPWRSAAALSLAALGDKAAAGRLCAAEIALARGWGAGRALGIALHAGGLVARGADGAELLTEAVRVLRPAPAPLELARALVDLGALQRRAGARTRARELLREGLDLAHAMGGLALRDRARRELVIAGRPGPAGMPLAAGTRSLPANCRWPETGRRRAYQPPDRPAAVRHPADRRKPSDEQLRQTPDRLAQRAVHRPRRQPSVMPGQPRLRQRRASARLAQHRGLAPTAGEPRAGGCSAWPVRCRSGAVPVVGLAAGDHGLQHREQLRPAAETLRRKAGYPRLPVKGQPPANAQFEFHNEAPGSCHAADRRPVRSGGHHGRHPRKVRPGDGDQGG